MKREEAYIAHGRWVKITKPGLLYGHVGQLHDVHGEKAEVIFAGGVTSTVPYDDLVFATTDEIENRDTTTSKPTPARKAKK